MTSNLSLRLLACGTMMAAAGAVPAQEIARLYAAQAPAGSAYVRVVNSLDKALKVEFGGKQNSLDGKRVLATDYRVIDASSDMSIKLDGKALDAVKLKAGSFNTIVVGGAKPLLIADATDARNDLKAELRFYNLARGCSASLSLQDGPAVFQHIAFEGSARRNINPVKAQLLVRCDGAAASDAVVLPILKSGDHVSFFLTGDSRKPRLAVQADATEAYSAAR